MMSWSRSTLGEVLGTIKNGVNCDQKSGTGNSKISRIETIASGEFDLSRVGHADLSVAEQERFKLSKNDILFSHINSPPHVGKTAILRSTADLYHGINLLLLRPIPDVDPLFLNYFLKKLHTEGYWRTICKQSVNQASVNQTDIKKVKFAFPDLVEQRSIVALLDQVNAKSIALLDNYRRQLDDLEYLRRSVFQKVFAGGQD